MKLLHVMAGAPTGGAENIFLESVLGLADGGYEQAVVTRANNAHRLESLRTRNIAVETVSFNPLWRFSTDRAIEAMVRRLMPDVIQYWMGRAGTFARPRAIPQVGWYGGYYKRARFAHCRYHVALTGDIARHIVAQGAAAGDVAIIRTFADFAPAAPTARASLATPADVPLLLALARLHWKKGLDVLLEALRLIPGAHLWIAGEGPLRAQLEAQTRALGIEDRVRFLGWRDDRAALLAACDVCVFPSRYEPFGTVTVDAWAAGKPLVAAAAQGPKDAISDGQDGLLVPIDDAPALASAIQRVLEEPGLKERLVAGGRASYAARHTKTVFLKDSAAFYNRIRAGA